MTKQYLITGGAGFIGSNYVHRLVKRGEKVIDLRQSVPWRSAA